MASLSSKKTSVESLAEDYISRMRNGERPEIAEYASRYPDLADEIRQFFPAIQLVEQFKPGSSAEAAEDQRSSERLAQPERLGDFVIVREIGRGGMGVVYEARQQSLGRTVALKVLPRLSLPDVRQQQRFVREARSAARLHHTNIVPVFGVGEEDGLHYYAMQFINGLSLDEVLEEVRRMRPHDSKLAAVDHDAESRHLHPELAPCGKADNSDQIVAQTVAASLLTGRFRCRDLDGSDQDDVNVAMISSEKDGATCPTEMLEGQPPDRSSLTNGPLTPRDSAVSHKQLVSGGSDSFTLPGTDVSVSSARSAYWQSVARIGVQVAEALQYAHDNGVLHRDIKPANLLLDSYGTVWVMDFGLAKVDDQHNLTHTGDIVGTMRYMAPERFSGEVDSRSDIYSLGLTLYELLAMRPAFDATNRHKLVDQVMHQSPPRLRSIDHSFPRDLETIVHKAIDRDFKNRYQTAGDLAADLQRFLGDEPISARRISPAARFGRWCRRNPRVAVLTAAVALLLLVVGIGGLSWALFAESARQKLAAAEDMAIRRLYQSYVAQAKANRRTGRLGQRLGSLQSVREAAALIPRLGLGDEECLELRNEAISCMTLPDLRVAIDWPMHRPNTFVGSIAFDPTLRHYVCPADESVCIRRVPSTGSGQAEIVSELKGVKGYPAAARFSPDGKLVAVRCEIPGGEHLHVWEWRESLELLEVTDRVSERAFDFHPSRRQLFTAVRVDERWRIATYDLDSGQRTLGGSLPSKPFELRCDPTGHHLAISFPQAEVVWVLDAGTGALIRSMDLYEDIFALAWHPRGKVLAVSRGFQVDLRDLAKPEHSSGVLTGHRWMIFELMFNHTGELLASHGLREGETRLWDLRTRETILVAKGHAAGFSRDGGRLAFRRGPRLGIWELSGGLEYRRLLYRDPTRRTGLNAGFDRTGRLLADGGSGGLRLWDVAGPKEVLHLETGKTNAARFDPNDGSLLTGGEQGLRRWPIASSSDGTLLLGPPQDLEVPVGSFVANLGSSADGSVVAAVLRNEGRIWVWDSSQNQPQFLTCAGKLGYVAVSPDGHWIAGGCFEYPGFFVWDAHTTEMVWQGEGAYTAGPVRFSPDGRHLITCGSDRYSLYSVGSWQESWVHMRSAAAPGAAAFVADASMAAIVESYDRLQLIDVGTGLEIATLDAGFDRGVVLHLEFSPDDAVLAASCASGGLRVWDLQKIRYELRSLGLDWDRPLPTPPASEQVPLAIELRKASESSSDSAMTSIALQSWANLKLDHDLTTGQPGDNNFASLPRGRLTAAGIPFELGEKLIQLASPPVPHRPSQVQGIAVGLRFQKLHLLQGVVEPGNVPLGAEVARYRVHYEDGQVETIPIRYGLDVWNVRAAESQLTHLHLETRPSPSLRTAWIGDNPTAEKLSKQLRLYLMSWSNPRPNVTVTHIDLSSANEQQESLVCAALTAEQ